VCFITRIYDQRRQEIIVNISLQSSKTTGDPYHLFSSTTNLATSPNIVALVQTAIARPHLLTLDLLSSLGSSNNVLIVLHDSHVLDRRILCTLSTRLCAPEDQVTLLAVGIFDVLALVGLVLLPSAVRQNLILVSRLAHGVLGETGAVESAFSRAIAIAPTPFVGNTTLRQSELVDLYTASIFARNEQGRDIASRDSWIFVIIVRYVVAIVGANAFISLVDIKIIPFVIGVRGNAALRYK
jgi:hypothetical protein